MSSILWVLISSFLMCLLTSKTKQEEKFYKRREIQNIVCLLYTSATGTCCGTLMKTASGRTTPTTRRANWWKPQMCIRDSRYSIFQRNYISLSFLICFHLNPYPFLTEYNILQICFFPKRQLENQVRKQEK